jgi:hypothetical protein
LLEVIHNPKKPVVRYFCEYSNIAMSRIKNYPVRLLPSNSRHLQLPYTTIVRQDIWLFRYPANHPSPNYYLRVQRKIRRKIVWFDIRRSSLQMFHRNPL